MPLTWSTGCHLKFSGFFFIWRLAMFPFSAVFLTTSPWVTGLINLYEMDQNEVFQKQKSRHQETKGLGTRRPSSVAHGTCVLVPAGTEFIFFPVGGLLLWFGFRMGMVSITHWCFRCCWAVLAASQGPLASHPTSWELAGDTARITDPRDIPDHMRPCLGINQGESWSGAAAGELARNQSVKLHLASLG